MMSVATAVVMIAPFYAPVLVLSAASVVTAAATAGPQPGNDDPAERDAIHSPHSIEGERPQWRKCPPGTIRMHLNSVDYLGGIFRLSIEEHPHVIDCRMWAVGICTAKIVLIPEIGVYGQRIKHRHPSTLSAIRRKLCIRRHSACASASCSAKAPQD
jgi:hypothetical protein